MVIHQIWRKSKDLYNNYQQEWIDGIQKEIETIDRIRTHTHRIGTRTHRIRIHTERNQIPTHINQDGKTNLDNKLHQRQRTLTLERPDVTDVDS